MHQTSFLKRHSLVLGIALMFLLTWPIGLSNAGVLPFHVPLIVVIFLGWGIIFASVIMTGLTLGTKGVVALLKRYLQWRVGRTWYLVAFLLGPSLVLAGVYVNAALTGSAPDFSTVMAHKVFGKSANLLLLIIPWFLYEVVSNGEEIGWRGYVLPRLQVKHTALTSSLILSVIWGIWHLPNFLLDFNIVRFGWFMVHMVAQTVILTWVYNGTKGSLLLTTLYHASANTVGFLVPMANTVSNENLGAYIVYVLLELATAVIVTLVTGPERLSRTEPQQAQEQTLQAKIAGGF